MSTASSDLVGVFVFAAVALGCAGDGRTELVGDGSVLVEDAAHVDAGAVDAGLGIGSDAAPPDGGPEPAGELVVLLAGFSDTGLPALTVEEARALVFERVADLFEEASYGAVSFTGDVYGPYALPIRASCDFIGSIRAAVSAADADVSFVDTRRILLLAPFECDWAGRSYTQPTEVTTDEGTLPFGVSVVSTHQPTPLFVAHELGHQYHLGHAGFYLCSVGRTFPDCFTSDTLDYYTTMGYGRSDFAPRHFNAIQKEHAGWLAPDRIGRVTASGRYAIAPIERLPGASDPPLLALRLPRGTAPDVYVEYRQPIGWDVGMDVDPYDPTQPTNVFLGALLHVPRPETGLGTMLFDASTGGAAGLTDIATAALEVGQTWVDPQAGHTVTVVERTPTSLTVDVVLAP